MTTLFDALESQKAKDEGMAKAARKRTVTLSLARNIAALIASGRPDRTCTADDVMQGLIDVGIQPEELGPAAGSIFRGKAWEFTGRWINSARVSNHAASIRVWRLK